MKISIITATYNSGITLEDTIKSVLIQDYDHIEYIIVDGGSKDDTLSIIRSYENKIRIRWISEPDRGIYDAMNKGIQMATGDVIGILNSDDFYHRSDAISSIASAFKKYKTESLFADLVFVNPDNLHKVVRYFSSKRFKPSQFRFGYMPAHPTFFTYKSTFQKYGLYQTNYKIAADYELLLRFLFIHKISYMYLPLNLLTMRTGGISTNSFKSKMIINREFLRACRENGIYTNYIFLIFRYFTKVFELLPSQKMSKLKTNSISDLTT